MKAVALFVPGLLFGAGLALSGMTNPAKVIGFLDVSGGEWDPTLACVMGGAVITFAVLNLLVHRREEPVLCGTLPGARGKRDLDAPLVVGAILFGVGWAMTGVCPGPGLVDLATLRPEVFAYVAAMAAGMVVAQRVFGADAPRSPAADPPTPTS